MENREKKSSAKDPVRAALLAAAVFVGTLLSIPSPLGGNLNAGDAVLLTGTFLVGIPWCVPACAIGAALADLVGYTVYLPATLAIKAGSSLLAAFLFRLLTGKGKGNAAAVAVAGIAAELLMTAGYYFYECFLFGNFFAPLANIPLNLAQGAFAVAVALFCNTHIKKRK